MESKQKPKLTYIECTKSGYHYGEALNMVCLEANCSKQSIGCSACIQQDHKKHLTKPLKLVLQEAQQHSKKIQPIEINSDTVIELISNHEKKIGQNFAKGKKKVLQYFENVQKKLARYFSGLIEQIQLKGNKSKADIEKIFEQFYSNQNVDILASSIQKILTMIPKNEAGEQPIKEKDLIQSIEELNKQIGDLLEKYNTQMITSTQNSFDILNKIVIQDIWTKSNYKFSTKFKHNQVNVFSPNLVKAGTQSGYKFALLEPDLEKSKSKKRFAFKLKEVTSSWLALGVCHKNIVANKGYSFVFNNIGHGGYLISSNGGSWSNSKAECNNVVKAFKFAKNDIILIQVNFDIKKIKFIKKNTAQTYELDFNLIPGDPLYACVLFYYPNDEVEYLKDVPYNWPN